MTTSGETTSNVIIDVKPTARTRRLIDAFSAVTLAMDDLDQEQRARVLHAVLALYGMDRR